jgi:hypothetical protein
LSGEGEVRYIEMYVRRGMALESAVASRLRFAPPKMCMRRGVIKNGNFEQRNGANERGNLRAAQVRRVNFKTSWPQWSHRSQNSCSEAAVLAQQEP